MKTKFPRILLWSASLLALTGAQADDFTDAFDVPDSELISAKNNFADKYTLFLGKLKVLDKKIVTPPTEIGQRNELLLDNPLIPDGENQPYSVSIDFQMSDVEASGALVMIFNYTSSQHFAYFRLRTASGNRNSAQLMITKNGQQAKPQGESVPVALVAGNWYRLTVKVPQSGEFQYEIAEADGQKSVLASGILLDKMPEAGPYTGGQVGFGASGAPFTLDNFVFHIGS